MTSPTLVFALCAEVKVEVRPTAAILDWASASGRPTTSGVLTRGPGAGGGGGGGGGAALFTVTSTTADVPTLPARSCAIAVSRCVPAVACVVFHDTVRGDEALASPRLMSSS